MESNQIAFLNKEQSGQVIQSRFHAREVRQLQTTLPGADSPLSNSRRAGYGLPCLKCHLYYPADLDECPTCHHKERVSAVAPKLPIRPAQAIPDALPDGAALEKEREEFLRQFKSHMLEAHAGVMNAPESVCRIPSCR